VRFSSAQLTPLRLPGFRNLFFATLASSAGTLIAAVALAIDVKARTNSGPWVAAVVVVEFLPTVVVGLLLGPLLDRLNRRSLMIAADAVRVGVFVALPFAPNAATVVALAAVGGVATRVLRPAG
jgi:MFS family permease